jgi:hypothetical protein
MTKRWRTEITYRNGDAPTVVQFEELADLHDVVEMWADWTEIEQIVITLNVSSATPRREEIESVSLDELLVTVKREWAKLGPLIDLEPIQVPPGSRTEVA